MYCGKCGAQIEAGAERCAVCGEPVDRSTEEPVPAHFRDGEAPRRPIAFAGFWLRSCAFIVDLLIVGLVLGPITFKPLLNNVGSQASPKDILAFYTGGSRQALAIALLVQLIYWLYYASLESSAWQASLGKKLFGLYVTDLAGKRISFARASGRHFGKLISQFILFFGYLLAGFTPKKQALHDMLAGCFVLRKT